MRDIKTQLLPDNHEYKTLMEEIPEDAKHYFTHDNGGRPFLVYVKNPVVWVAAIPSEDRYYFSNDHEDLNEEDSKWMYIDIKMKIEDCETIWIGKSPDDNRFDGNSILVKRSIKDDELGNEYVYIGESIKSFHTPDRRIIDFISPVGNSDVPYPYAIDDKGDAYLMIENVTISNYTRNDPYRSYYDSGIKRLSVKEKCPRQW